MRIEIHHTNFHSTPDLDSYAERHLEPLAKLLGRYKEDILVVVELARTTKHHKKGDVFYAEATVEIPGKPTRATFTGSDIYLAIDEVARKLKTELRREKDKSVSQRKK
jgi:ribosomal subunit interface protein